MMGGARWRVRPLSRARPELSLQNSGFRANALCIETTQHPRPTAGKRKETEGQMQSLLPVSAYTGTVIPQAPQQGRAGVPYLPATDEHVRSTPKFKMKLAPVWEKNFIRRKKYNMKIPI